MVRLSSVQLMALLYPQSPLRLESMTERDNYLLIEEVPMTAQIRRVEHLASDDEQVHTLPIVTVAIPIPETMIALLSPHLGSRNEP